MSFFFTFSCSLSFSLSLSSVVPALVDRLGDGKDQVRDQAQTLILKLMEEAATPMVSDTFCILAIFVLLYHQKWCVVQKKTTVNVQLCMCLHFPFCDLWQYLLLFLFCARSCFSTSNDSFSLCVYLVCLGEVIPRLQTQELPKQRRTVSVPGRHTQCVSHLKLCTW